VGSGDSQTDTNVLTPATGVSSVAHLACGLHTVLATTTDGALMVWGQDKYAQLGRGIKTNEVWEAVEVSTFLYKSDISFLSHRLHAKRNLVTVYW
jgi:alpha-tubulin suppressor-like RCC1 family protein